MKKLIALVFTIFVYSQYIFGYPISNVHIGDYIYKLNGDYTAYIYCSSTLEKSVIEIPGSVEYEGQSFTVTEVASFNKNKFVEKVIIPKSITTLQDGCFKECENLKEAVFLGDEINFCYNVFWKSGLEIINFPSRVTLLGKDNFGNLLKNTKVKSFTIPDNSKIVEIDGMSELESVKLNAQCTELYMQNLPRLKMVDFSNNPQITYIGASSYFNQNYGGKDGEYPVFFGNPEFKLDALTTLYIPKTAKVLQGYLVWEDAFEGFDISPENPYYTFHDGALYSHNMDTLYHHPGREDVSIREGVKVVIDQPGGLFWALSTSLQSLTYPSTLTTLNLRMQRYNNRGGWADKNGTPNYLVWDHGFVKNLRFADPTEQTPVDSIDITMCGFTQNSNAPMYGYYYGENLYIGRSLCVHDYSYIREIYEKNNHVRIFYPYEQMLYNFAVFDYENVEIGEHVKKINVFIYPKKLKTIKLHCSTPPFLRHYKDRYDRYGSNKLHPSEAGALPNSIEMNEFTDFITPVVYVPKGSLEAYRNAPMWREFQNIVEWDESGVEPTDAELLQVAVAGGEITVSGINDNTKVEIYNMSGMLVGTAVGPCTLNVNSAPGVYILRAGNITRKLRL